MLAALGDLTVVGSEIWGEMCRNSETTRRWGLDKQSDKDEERRWDEACGDADVYSWRRRGVTWSKVIVGLQRVFKLAGPSPTANIREPKRTSSEPKMHFLNPSLSF